MGKVVWKGEVDIGDGEKVFITVRRTRPAIPTGKYELSAEGIYRGQHFLIDDNGIGMEH